MKCKLQILKKKFIKLLVLLIINLKFKTSKCEEINYILRLNILRYN